MRIIFSTEK